MFKQLLQDLVYFKKNYTNLLITQIKINESKNENIKEFIGKLINYFNLSST